MGKTTKTIEQIGTKYGKLTVIGESNLRIRRRVCWKCQCECGKILDVIGTDLRTGRKTSCGECDLHPNAIDETGNIYGNLTVLHKAETVEYRKIKWVCRCKCGNIVEVLGTHLRNGNTRSCGCTADNQIKNEVGNRYGKLIVIERAGNTPQGKATWFCKCDCGNIVEVPGTELRYGQVVSCGCIKSIGESKINQILQQNNINYKKEITFCDLISSKSGYPRFDFGIYNKENKLLFLIEYQGKQHFEDCGYFGKFQREETDGLKFDYCNKKNIKLYYINYYEDVEQRLSEILNENKIFI